MMSTLEKRDKPRAYPYLGVKGEYVILFRGPNEGVFVAPSRLIGSVSSSIDEENYSIYEGKVILEN